MENDCQNCKTEIYSLNEDIVLNECIDINIHCLKERNKERAKKRLHEIFIFAKITDYIALKDALWISDSLNLSLFAILCNNPERYLDGRQIEPYKSVRPLFGRNRKNKELHMTYSNFRRLFIHCTLFHINEILRMHTLNQ